MTLLFIMTLRATIYIYLNDRIRVKVTGALARYRDKHNGASGRNDLKAVVPGQDRTGRDGEAEMEDGRVFRECSV